MKTKKSFLLLGFFLLLLCGSACQEVSKEATGLTGGTLQEESQKESQNETQVENQGTTQGETLGKTTTFDYASIPDYQGQAYVEVNGGIPLFTANEITDTSYENYEELDELGRCQVASACIGKDLMPTQERGTIGQVRPSGWHTVKYDCVDGKYLYNRCHLIGYQLTGENADPRNLITGTRYLNVEGMLPFENQVADYVSESGNHVLYRVTPYFQGDELLARGVFLEAYSVEDQGAGICFHVFCYNVQPDILIDYATGDSSYVGDQEETEIKGEAQAYVVNKNTGVFHHPDCSSVSQMAEHNKIYVQKSREELMEEGYKPCGNCNP